MIHDKGEFKGARNVNVAYQIYLPQTEQKAAILLVHGLGEHSGRYQNLIQQLLPLGFAVYTLDHIGHGLSGGHCKFVESFDDFTQTLDIFLQRLEDQYGQQALFILGHSMGGLIAAKYLLTNQHRFLGAILSAPALKTVDKVSPLLLFIGNFLSKFFPKVGILPINPNKVSRDPEVVSAYMNDPLIHKEKTSARLATELLKTMTLVNARAKQLELPILIIQGTADEIVHPDGATAFFEHIGSSDKTLKQYEGLYHEAFNEPEKEQVITDLKNWLAEQLQMNKLSGPL